MATLGMSDAARKQWAFKREMEEEATQEARDFAASLPQMPMPPHRVKGELPVEGVDPDAEPVIEGTRAVEWDAEVLGKMPNSARLFAQAAIKHKYDTIVSHHYGERRGSHGRLLDPPAGTYCTVMGRRGTEAFMAAWVKPDGEDKKWAAEKYAYDYSEDVTPARPQLVKPTELKKRRFT